MSVLEIAFVIGPLGGLLIVPVAVILALAPPRPRWSGWALAVLVPTATVSWVAHWSYWGRAFDHADAYEDVPEALTLVGDSATLVCGAAVAGLALVAVTVRLGAAGRRSSDASAEPAIDPSQSEPSAPGVTPTGENGSLRRDR